MQSNILWRNKQNGSLEHCAVQAVAGLLVAESVVIGQADDGWYRLHYSVRATESGEVQAVAFHLRDGSDPLQLERDGDRWYMNGEAVEAVRGCTDVDIQVTPLTNGLTIRRLGLAVGEAATLDVAYVALPQFGLKHVRQEYTRLGERHYRYRSLTSGYTGELHVDAHGLVTRYADLFERLPTRPALDG